MLRSFSALCALMVGLVFLTPNAHAQVFGGDPSAAITPVEPPAAYYPSSTFGENNAHLKSLLTLQYQMQVLRRLIEHEKAVNQMVQSAVAIGLYNPAIPKPDHDLCEQVPGNIACAQAYKDMYPQFMADTPDMMAAPLAANALNGANVSDPANPGMPAPSDNSALAAVESSSLFWLDVTCLNEKCTAVITPDPKNPMARYRVSLGETLPDGAVISRISTSGVSLKQKDETIILEPAPQA